eukprot:PhM_4_TR7658/c0_g1_i1/m.103278
MYGTLPSSHNNKNVTANTNTSTAAHAHTQLDPGFLYEYTRAHAISKDFFHAMAQLSWPKLLLATLLTYLTANVFFALMLLLPCFGDVEIPDIVDVQRTVAKSTCSTSGAFLFSVMTISGIGGYNVKDFDVPDSARSWVVFVVFIEAYSAYCIMALFSAVVITKASAANTMRHRLVFSPTMLLTRHYNKNNNNENNSTLELAIRISCVHFPTPARASVRVYLEERNDQNHKKNVKKKAIMTAAARFRPLPTRVVESCETSEESSDASSCCPAVEMQFYGAMLRHNTLVTTPPPHLFDNDDDDDGQPIRRFLVIVNAIDGATGQEFEATRRYEVDVAQIRRCIIMRENNKNNNNFVMSPAHYSGAAPATTTMTTTASATSSGVPPRPQPVTYHPNARFVEAEDFVSSSSSSGDNSVIDFDGDDELQNNNRNNNNQLMLEIRCD